MSSPTSGTFPNPHANMSSTSRTITTDGIGYKSVIDKARAIQREDAELLHQAAKARHAQKLSRAKEGRQRADEAAIRMASSSNLNIDTHYQQLLVEIKQNVKATFETEWIAEVREDVYRRHQQITSEYEAQIKDETYAFLVDSLEPVVRAELRQQLESQIREELREELRAEVRSELSAQHQTPTPDCHQGHAVRGQVYSKAIETVEEAVIDLSSPTIPTHIDTLDVNAGANDIINDLDIELPEEVSNFVREVEGREGSHDYDAQFQQPELAHLGRPENDVASELDHAHGEVHIVAQSQGHQSPLMASVEREKEVGSAKPCDDRSEDQSASRSLSVSSKRSWFSEDDYEEDESPSKRRKSVHENEDEDEMVPWPFADDPDDVQVTNHFQHENPTSPPSSDDYFTSDDEEQQDVITPGPTVPLAPQFVQPGCLIAQTNTADDAWIIPDSDNEEGIEGEVEGGGTLVGTGFVAVNKAGVDVRANELFLTEGDDY